MGRSKSQPSVRGHRHSLLLLCQGLVAEHPALGLALQPTLCSVQMSAWSLTQSQHIPSVADGNLPHLKPRVWTQGVQPFPSAAQQDPSAPLGQNGQSIRFGTGRETNRTSPGELPGHSTALPGTRSSAGCGLHPRAPSYPTKGSLQLGLTTF